jgi:succinoglycan biosynthesis transport protein ExoP
MKHTLANVPAQVNALPLEGESAKMIELDAVLAGARRQWKVIATGVAIMLALAIIYIVMAPKMYTGTSIIVIDFHSFGTATTGESAELVFNTTAVDNEVEILKSQRVALDVIDKLKLLEDPEFTAPSLLGRIIGLLPFTKPKAPADPEAALTMRVLDKFAYLLTITRVNKTYVLQIDFLSKSGRKAADIANAIAHAYVTNQLDAKLESNTRASGWLQERIQELQKKSLEANLAVQKYRENNNLVAAGGRLINDQQLSDLSTQISAARADVARVQVRYDHIRGIIDNKQTNAAISEELSSPVITELRNHYLDTSKRRNDFIAKVGANHVQAIGLEREMQGYEAQIFEELGRIAATYQSDLEIAKKREQSLSESLASLAGTSAGDSRMIINLQQQQQTADTYRILSQNFMERYQQLVQQQSFPITDTRVIARAITPSSASQPKTLLIIAASLFLGIAGGSGAAMLREYRDRSLRTGADVRSELALEFLGILPLQKPGAPQAFGGLRESDANSIAMLPPIMKVPATNPFSRFADTIRTMKVAIDSQPSSTARGKTIGIVSAGAGEGKTVTSGNLAVFCAETGARTLLVDADLRKCAMSKNLKLESAPGVVEVTRNPGSFEETIIKLSELLYCLPAGNALETANSSEVMRSSGMEKLLTAAAEKFDYVIIDLPPLISLIDARAIAPLLDHVLFVVEWGKTPRSAARDVLIQNPIVHEKCLGAVLNKVDPQLISYYAPQSVEAYGVYH